MNELTITQDMTNPAHTWALRTFWGDAAPVMTRAQRRQAALLRAARELARIWEQAAQEKVA